MKGSWLRHRLATFALILGVIALLPLSGVSAAPSQQEGGVIDQCNILIWGTTEGQEYEDYYFEGKAGLQLRITVSQAQDSDLIPLVTLTPLSGFDFLVEAADHDWSGQVTLTATLPRDATYYIHIYPTKDGNGVEHGGAFSLNFECLTDESQGGGSREIASDPGGPIACGGEVQDELTESNYEDEWTFTSTAGKIVTIVMRYVSGDIDPMIYLRGPSNQELLNTDTGAGGIDAGIGNYSLPQDGIYTIVARTSGGYGTYKLQLACRDPEPEVQAGSGAQVEDRDIFCGSNFENTIDDVAAYDNWYYFANAGQRINVAMRVVSGDLDPYLTVYLPDGQSITDDDAGGGLDAALSLQPTAGERYMIVAGRVGGSGTYRITLECLETIDNGGSDVIDQGGVVVQPGQAATIDDLTIACGDSIENTLDDAASYDNWTLQAQAGQKITVDMTAVTAGIDTYLVVIAPDGSRQENDDIAPHSNFNSQVIIDPAQAGQYKFITNKVAGSGTYRIAVACEAGAQQGGQQQDQQGGMGVVDQGMILCEQTQTGGITASTWYNEWTFDGTAGEEIEFIMHRSSGDLDPYLYVFAPNGSTFEDDDTAGNQGAYLKIALPSTGAYTIRTTRFDGQAGTTTGNYLLSVSCPLGGQQADQSGGQQQDQQGGMGVVDQGMILCEQTQTGGITASTWYNEWTFDGTAGEEIEFIMHRSSGDLDPYLYVFAPNGSTFEDDDTAGNQGAYLKIALPSTGAYTIRTTRFDGQAGTTTGNYLLSVSCPLGGAMQDQQGGKPANSGNGQQSGKPSQSGAQAGAAFAKGDPASPVVIEEGWRVIDRWRDYVEPLESGMMNLKFVNFPTQNEEDYMASQEVLAVWMGAVFYDITDIEDSALANTLWSWSQTNDTDGMVNPYVMWSEPQPGQQTYLDFKEDAQIGLSGQPYNILMIAMHAVGHALGLEHSEFADSAMYPYLKANEPLPSGGDFLSKDDVDQIVTLYAPGDRLSATYAARTFSGRAFRVRDGATLSLAIPYPAGTSSVDLRALCAINTYKPGASGPASWKCSSTWDDTLKKATFTIATGGGAGAMIGGRVLLINTQAFKLVDSKSVTVQNGGLQTVQLNAPAGTVVIETVTAYAPSGAAGFGYTISPTQGSDYEVGASGGAAGSSVSVTLDVYQPVKGSSAAELVALSGQGTELGELPLTPNREAGFFSVLSVLKPGGTAGVDTRTVIEALYNDPNRECSTQNPMAKGTLCLSTYVQGSAQAQIATYLFQAEP